MAQPTTHKRVTMNKPGRDSLMVPMGRGNKETTIGQAIAGMRGGENREGFLGDGTNLIKKPGYEATEDLSAMEKQQKKLWQNLLGKVIEPNALSSKSSPAMDRRSLVTKLNRSLLEEILRLVPDSMKRLSNEELQKLNENPDLISESDKAEIQTLYLDVSP